MLQVTRKVIYLAPSTSQIKGGYLPEVDLKSPVNFIAIGMDDYSSVDKRKTHSKKPSQSLLSAHYRRKNI